MIDINYLKSLLKLFDASTATELKIEQEGTSIKLSKTNDAAPQPTLVQYAPAATAALPAPALTVPTAPAAPATTTDSAPAAPAASDTQYHEILSPIVGTYYRSPSPDDPPFVEVGSTVSPGMTMCIVEAMKLMNEIECDTYGRVAKIMVENGQPVEYNQVLFLIERES